MLREYRLTNFKAFGETVTIPIRPLTLIFGANSSGKSSIFQSLLLLKQTLEEAKNPATALLPKGSLVDLGTYRDFVHRHETSGSFEFEARFDLESTEHLTALTQEILKRAAATDAGLSVQFSCDKENHAVVPSQVHIATGDETLPTIISCTPKRRQYDEDKDTNSQQGRFVASLEIDRELKFWRYWCAAARSFIKEEEDVNKYWGLLDTSLYKNFLHALKAGRFDDAIELLMEEVQFSQAFYENFLPYFYENVGVGLFEDTIPSPKEEQKFPRLRLSTYDRPLLPQGLDVFSIVLHVCSLFKMILEDLVYLGPLRRHPERRHYEFSGDTTDYVGQSGEYLPSILFEDQELVEKANSDLERLGVKYRLKLDKLQNEDASPSNVFSLRLVDTRTGIDASLRDVGFGISQVLPIVVQNRLSEEKTLLIEQPEIHLHPAHQAELGDMFIRSALGEQHNTLLLETHSEHLLLRIMRRMRETSTGKLPEGAIPVRPEDVAVLFVESDGSQSIVREMPLNERGDLVKAWPGGFFEEGLREIL